MQLNKVMLMGYLCEDPKVRTTSGGKTVVNARLGVTHRYKKSDGTKAEDTVFMSFVIWGGRGEAFAKNHKKGDLAYIEGRLIDDSWTKDDGTQVHVAKCPEGHGKIKSPMCCGADMSCSI